MSAVPTHFKDRLQNRKNKGNLRQLTCHQKGCIDFSSNDYLGFLREGILNRFIEEEQQKLLGCSKFYGASGSRLLTGNSSYYEEVEQEIAAFHGTAAGLIFSSGYLANLGLLSSIIRSEDTVIFDAHIHASATEALKIIRPKALPFRHQDLEHLAKRLANARGTIFVCVESIYSCDGSETNLKVVHQLCQEFCAYLIVDEAHATGCIGKNGKGGVHKFGIQAEVFARLHTFSKALGGHGAIIVGSALLREYLINFARSFMYTTALPLQSLITIRSAYRALKEFPSYQQKLQKRIMYFNQKALEMELPVKIFETSIKSLPILGNETAIRAAAWFNHRGFDVRALLSPTVQRGKECLRICLHAFNSTEEIDALLKTADLYYKNQIQ